VGVAEYGANVQFFLLRGQVRKVLRQPPKSGSRHGLGFDPDKLKFQIRTACFILVAVTDCRFRSQPIRVVERLQSCPWTKSRGDRCHLQDVEHSEPGRAGLSALCDANLANLRQGTPDNCRHEQKPEAVTSVATSKQVAAVLQHGGRVSRRAISTRLADWWRRRYLGRSAERKSTS